jgi:hypothetical protein
MQKKVVTVRSLNVLKNIANVIMWGSNAHLIASVKTAKTAISQTISKVSLVRCKMSQTVKLMKMKLVLMEIPIFNKE